MTDERDLHFIAGSLGLQKEEPVLEIGPGLGALTRALLDQGARVTAVEKDRSLSEHLRAHFEGRPLRVFCQDILLFDPEKDLSLGSSIAVAGNIPYNITSPILFWLIKHRKSVRCAVLTMQWEVAERLTGKPGNKTWGALSVSVQAYADAVLLKKIPKSHFYPVPKVDSAVVRLDFLDRPRFREEDQGMFHALVAKAFQKRRKTLLNALRDEEKGFTREALSAAFEACGVSPQQRPETLTVLQWAALAARLSKPTE